MKKNVYNTKWQVFLHGGCMAGLSPTHIHVAVQSIFKSFFFNNTNRLEFNLLHMNGSQPYAAIHFVDKRHTDRNIEKVA